MSESKSSFVRWQKIAIDQLGYTLNLIFTLTIAALGYWFILLQDRDFCPGRRAKCALWLGLSFLIISAVSAVVCTLNRLQDFRGTAQRARHNPNAPSQNELHGLGKFTWRLLYIQVLGFAGGIVALGIALLVTYGTRFF